MFFCKNCGNDIKSLKHEDVLSKNENCGFPVMPTSSLP